MQGLIMAAQLIAGLSILIILHELGHFVAARAFGIKVEKFYLFFDAWGFKLFSFKVGDTEYGIGWLPLGGYVKIAGMIDESMDKAQMAEAPKEWEFRSKPAWQRLIVMIAGVVVNIVLGVIIYWMLSFSYGEQKLPLTELQYGVVPSKAAMEIGLQKGDIIVAVAGKEVKYFDDLNSPEVLLGGVMLDIDRKGERIQIPIPNDMLDLLAKNESTELVSIRHPFKVDQISPNSPAEDAGLQAGDNITAVNEEQVQYFDEFKALLDANAGSEVVLCVHRENEIVDLPVKVNEDGTIGFSYTREALNFEEVKFGLFEAFPKGVNLAFGSLYANIKGLGKVVTGEISAQKSLQGPIGIAKIYGGEFNWYKFWALTGMISMVLAFMNILPIPALDGGHTLFLLFEMVVGRPLSDKFLERAQMAGFVILVVLMIFVFGNDIYNLFR